MPNLPGLYSVPITGSIPVRLNPSVDNGMTVHGLKFEIGPNSLYVIYGENIDRNAYALDPDLSSLYGVPITGGTPARLSPSGDSGTVTGRFRISPNGEYVVYEQTTDKETDAPHMHQLYSAPIGGGVPERLSPLLGKDAHYDYWFQISPPNGELIAAPVM